MTRRAVLAMLAAGIAACGSDPVPGERGDAVWGEFLDDATVRAELPWLAAHGADLYLAVRESRIGDAALATLLADAAAAGVGVRIWLLLDDADGYWPNEHNLPAMRDAVMRLADWRDAAALPIDWVVFDLEMSLERSRAIADILRTQGSIAAVDAIKAGRDPTAFVQHRADLAALVDDVRARGLRVAAVTYPMILDDPGDGDDDIQDELDVPVLDIEWDEASYMVYQSMLFDLTGEWHDAAIVTSYAASARERHGARGAIALGIVGMAGIEPVAMPYPDAATLAADRAAARSNVARISVYSLDGIRQQPDRDAWMADASGPEPTSDPAFLRDLVVGLLD